MQIFRCVPSVLFALLMLPSLASAADLRQLVDRLGVDDFDAKMRAVQDLAALGDSHVIPTLTALSAGALYTTAEGRVVVGEPADDHVKILDPLDASPLGDVAGDALDKVRVNNRLRGVIEAALGSLTLSSRDPQVRLRAAHEALKHPSAAAAAALETALAVEKDLQARAALSLALAVARIVSGSKDQRLAAVAELAKATDPQIRSLLAQQRDSTDDPELRRAIDAALSAVDGRRVPLTDTACRSESRRSSRKALRWRRAPTMGAGQWVAAAAFTGSHTAQALSVRT